MIVGTDGRTVELDAADGRVRWRRAFPFFALYGSLSVVDAVAFDVHRLLGGACLYGALYAEPSAATLVMRCRPLCEPVSLDAIDVTGPT